MIEKFKNYEEEIRKMEEEFKMNNN
jgi:hypothetical protein